MRSKIFQKSGYVLLSIVPALMLLTASCEARDFAASAAAYVTILKTVGQILAPAGIILGGCIQQIAGAEHIGSQMLKSGVLGCLCIFGGPAFVGMMHSIFGTM
jgi:hypothetical protein